MQLNQEIVTFINNCFFNILVFTEVNKGLYIS